VLPGALNIMVTAQLFFSNNGKLKGEIDVTALFI